MGVGVLLSSFSKVTFRFHGLGGGNFHQFGKGGRRQSAGSAGSFGVFHTRFSGCYSGLAPWPIKKLSIRFCKSQRRVMRTAVHTRCRPFYNS